VIAQPRVAAAGQLGERRVRAELADRRRVPLRGRAELERVVALDDREPHRPPPASCTISEPGT
jgi:hypothetical protein